MWYAIISQDIDESSAGRAANRPAHLARLQELVRHGRLLIAGPHPAVDADEPGEAGYTGSLVVAEFECLEDAEAWADSDPYREAGVYDRVVVKPFKLVLP